jgi:anti-sigma-K factor RskA
LGLLPSAEGGTTMALNLPRDIAEALATSQLAVSLEPSGGSTTGLPTGPVLFSGAVIPVDL